MGLVRTKIFIGMLVLCMGGRVFAQESEAEVAADDGPLDLSEFPGMLIDDVVVPVPSEIFSIMGKLGDASFEGEIVAREPVTFRNRSRLALAFGIAVADGFIAVQAENKKGIEQAGRSVLRLSEALGLRDKVVKHTKSITDAAANGDWEAVRKELDRTQKTVRDTMEEMRDGDLANCVSAGGWIRGTEAMTSLISSAYKVDQAELLNQPDLANHFSQLIGKMDKQVRRIEHVQAADTCLKQIANFMTSDGDGKISSQAILDIHAASKKLVETVYAPKPKTEEAAK